jgi:hypothetical protein
MFSHLSKGPPVPSEFNQSQPFGAPGSHSAGARNPSFDLFFSMEDGPMFDPFKIPGSRSLHDRKLATWALLVGETRSSAVHAEMRRRPHRGMLPDVDFSRAVPVPGRPSLVRRFIRLLRPRLVKADTPTATFQEGERGGTEHSGAHIDGARSAGSAMLRAEDDREVMTLSRAA